MFRPIWPRYIMLLFNKYDFGIFMWLVVVELVNVVTGLWIIQT